MTTYKILGTDLASRRIAAVERESFLTDYWHNQSVAIDFSDVESISESYADEFFGVLVLKFGLSEVLAKLKVSNAKESVLKAVAQSMRRRADAQKIAA